MGFKFKKIYFPSRRGEWYVENNTDNDKYENVYTRAASVIRELVNALINMNVGWEIDTDYNLSLTNYYNVPYRNYDNYMPGLFLKNTISGNKLFMCYIAASGQNSIDVPDSFLMPCGDRTPEYTGLIMSMIPGESGQSFGHSFDSSFLPSSATRLYGTCESCGKTNIRISYARCNIADIEYQYGIFGTPYCVGISCGYIQGRASESRICYFIGRVLESLAHKENTPQAKYGVVQFSQSAGQQNMEAGVQKNVTLNYKDSGQTTNIKTICTQNFLAGYTESTSSNSFSYSSGHFFKVDGSPIGYTATSQVRIFPENYGQLSGLVKLQDSNIRWVPYVVGVVSTDLLNDGIIPGDGIKGFLDTDLFRCARVDNGQTVDNGSFIGYGNGSTESKYLLLGWDSSNTDII